MFIKVGVLIFYLIHLFYLFNLWILSKNDFFKKKRKVVFRLLLGMTMGMTLIVEWFRNGYEYYKNVVWLGSLGFILFNNLDFWYVIFLIKLIRTI